MDIRSILKDANPDTNVLYIPVKIEHHSEKKGRLPDLDGFIMTFYPDERVVKVMICGSPELHSFNYEGQNISISAEFFPRLTLNLF